MAATEILDACLKTGDEAAWRAFIARFQPLIAGSISRVAHRYGYASHALIDDLIQETYLRLCKDNCKALRSFKARHDEAIFGYLKVIATSVALDHFRGRATQKRRVEVEDDGAYAETSQPAASIEQSTLLHELERRLAESQSERDRTIFWLHYRQGYTARDIAAMPGFGLTQKGVESCIFRLTQLLRTAVNPEFESTKGFSSETTLGGVR